MPTRKERNTVVSKSDLRFSGNSGDCFAEGFCLCGHLRPGKLLRLLTNTIFVI